MPRDHCLSRPVFRYNLDVISDTRPEIEEIWIKMLRQCSPARKMQMVAELNETVRQLALSGLRSQYPEDSPARLKRRLADLILGEELALKVYGPLSDIP